MTMLRRLALMLGLFAAVAVQCAPAWSAGAFAVGKCGAYGHAFDLAGSQQAIAAANARCKGGNCKTVTMNKACAALAVDMKNPCGGHGYAVAPRISTALNAASRECYKFGGKDCVIRAWACDARG
jgi:hypothetical protein